jgi:SdrD B-like protein
MFKGNETTGRAACGRIGGVLPFGAALASALVVLTATTASAQVVPACAEGDVVCGFVWNDVNGNGTLEAGEPGLEGVIVSAYSGTTLIASRVTDPDGRYTFSSQELPPITGGDYRIIVDSTLPPLGAGTLASPVMNPGSPDASLVDSDGIDSIPGFSYVDVAVEDTFTFHIRAFGFHAPAPPSACTIPAASQVISITSWNKFKVPLGAAPVVWVHAQFRPTDVPTTTKTTVLFTGASFVLNGHAYPLPNGLVTFDPAAPSVSTTTFDAPNNRWLTTINPNFISDENFFVGAAIPVDATISGGGKATIRFTTQADDSDLSFSWQWSAAVYTYWPANWNSALIQPYHGNGLHADTPDSPQVQQSLIAGPRGGGGSNFTGSWSATGHGSC